MFAYDLYFKIQQVVSLHGLKNGACYTKSILRLSVSQDL